MTNISGIIDTMGGMWEPLYKAYALDTVQISCSRLHVEWGEVLLRKIVFMCLNPCMGRKIISKSGLKQVLGQLSYGECTMN